MNADLLERLLAAGTPTALVAEVALEIARAEVSGEAKAEPSAGALRTRRYRERLERDRHAASQNVTGDGPVTAVTENVTADPSPDKAPQTPKINPTPHTGGAPASEPTHEAGLPGWMMPEATIIMLGAYLGGLLAARSTALASLWNGTPPPPGVSDEVWTGYLAHRKALPRSPKLTPRAYKLLCEKLATLADAGHPPGDMLDRAIDHGWITVHPPKEARNDNSPRHRHDRPSAWAPRAGIAGLEPASLDD